MIRIERSSIPPSSLAEESQKSNGSYRKEDFIRQLAADFHEKCYICEIKPVQDPQVEHRLPHYGRKLHSRVFDWSNLFYSCAHCNSVKNSSKYEKGIIDCCVRDPEELLSYDVQYGGVKVRVMNSSDEEALLTADLIEEVFNADTSGIRLEASRVRLRLLQYVMNSFVQWLDRYQKNPDLAAKRTLRGFLKRSSAFSGFTRSYLRNRNMADLLKSLDVL